MKRFKEKIGTIGIGIATVLTLVGGVAIFIYTGVTWTLSEIAPVQAETQANTVNIASLSQKVDDIDSKVDFIAGHYKDYPTSTP